MLWLRALLFTLVMPTLFGVLAPYWLRGSRPLQSGPWRLGWIPIAIGATVYLSCLLSFLAAHGTPAPFFARKLRAVIGEEPASLVSAGLYRHSRNPMYVGVLLVVFGQALLFASSAIAVYGLVGWLLLNLAVRCIEEPHLRAKQGAEYEEYCRQVPRWIGVPRSRG